MIEEKDFQPKEINPELPFSDENSEDPPPRNRE